MNSLGHPLASRLANTGIGGKVHVILGRRFMGSLIIVSTTFMG
jgi:hypothetical protein